MAQTGLPVTIILDQSAFHETTCRVMSRSVVGPGFIGLADDGDAGVVFPFYCLSLLFHTPETNHGRSARSDSSPFEAGLTVLHTQ